MFTRMLTCCSEEGLGRQKGHSILGYYLKNPIYTINGYARSFVTQKFLTDLEHLLYVNYVLSYLQSLHCPGSGIFYSKQYFVRIFKE